MSQITSRSADDSATAEPTWSQDGPPGPPMAPDVRAMGRYTLLGELGSGGMGVVYKAWDPALDRPVALKVLLAGRLASQRHLARFLDEARAIARLDHPALVEVYDIGLVDGCPYFTMEFVAGDDLERAAADAPLEPVRACRLLAQVARGLEQAHGQGIVHRDVKPANILVDADDAPRLIDFGVARFLESTGERTRTGQVVGTPAYMAPEQARGDLTAIGPATDVFGLGATLYRLVTGYRPSRLDLGSLDGAPRDLLAICVAAMADAPADRYPSMGALADELERFARGEPVQAALPGFWRRTRWRLHRGRGALIGAAIAAALAGLAWLGVYAWETREAQHANARREAAAETRLNDALAEGRRLRDEGAPDAARRLEDDATLHPAVQETRALARFHLERVADARARTDRALARAAASSAYAAARHADEEAAAMLALGRVFVDERRYEALRAIVDAFERRFPERQAALVPLRLEADMGALNLGAAAESARRAGDPRAPILAALSRGVVTGWTPRTLDWHVNRPMGHGDIDGDGHPELFMGPVALRTDDPRLPRFDVPLLDRATVVQPLARGLAMVHAYDDGLGRRLMTVDDGGWRSLSGLENTHHWAYADLDGDGVSRVFGVGGWQMRAFGPGPDGAWITQRPHPATDATRVQAAAVLATRFAERGPALVVATSEWKTYDLRIYTAAPDGALRLAARRKVGKLIAATLVERAGADPLIAVGVQAMPPEPRTFPPDRPSGAAPGVHLFEWAADGLEHRGHIPLDIDDEQGMRLSAGDLDGDGRRDLVVTTMRPTPSSTVYGAEGTHPAIPLVGLDVLLVTDVDGDGRDELVALDHPSETLWSVGAGESPLPGRLRQGSTLSVARPGPAAIDELGRLGLVDSALDAWRRRIRLGQQADDAAWRAGELADSADRPVEAARFYLRAARGERTAPALRRAARAFGRALDRPAQRDALARLAEYGAASADEKARLAALDARLAARVDLEPGGPLDPRWRIVVPDRLRVDRAAGELEVTSDAVGTIARLPVVATGGPIGVEVAMRTPRVEYGSTVMIRLVAEDAEGQPRTLFDQVNVGWGGGSIVFQRVMAGRRGMPQLLAFNRHLRSTGGDPLHARLEYDPQDGRLAAFEYTTGRRLDGGSDGERRPRPGERLFLEISGSSPRGYESTMRAGISRLMLDGLRIDDRPLSPEEAAVQEAARALAESRPADVLSAVQDRRDPAATALRLAARYDLGLVDDAEVLARLGDAIDAPAQGPIVRMLLGRLRRDPLHFAPLLRRALGPEADRLLGRVFVAPLDKHPLDPELRLAARALLLGAGPETTDPDTRLRLLLARLTDHRLSGRIGAARADLARYRAVLEGLPADDGDATERGRQWGALYRHQAEIDARAGDYSAAAEAIRAALAIAPAPELMADALLASPALTPLHDQPIWRAVQRAAAWSDPP